MKVLHNYETFIRYFDVCDYRGFLIIVKHTYKSPLFVLFHDSVIIDIRYYVDRGITRIFNCAVMKPFHSINF